VTTPRARARRSRRGRTLGLGLRCAGLRAAVALALCTGLWTACGPASGGARDPADGALRLPGAPVLLISIDTLRADRLGCYGYERGTSPVLDAFAEESVLFEEVYATSCKTAESHMSLFTSLPVSAHGVSNASARLGLPLREVGKNRLMLGQVLRRAGYWNSAILGGGNMLPQMGFARGYEGRFRSELLDVSVIVDLVLRAWDEARAQERPPFVFMHTYQVHGPYMPPAGFRERFAPTPAGVVGARLAELEALSFSEMGLSVGTTFWDGVEDFGPEDAAYLSDLYDGEVAYTDHELGRLFDGLRERNLFDRMIVVILSDHGEEFAEHGEYQHDQLYTETLHVPLLIRLPGGRAGGTRVSGQASLLDVMPTLLELLGLEGPGTMTGQSLLPAIAAGRIAAPRPVLAERTMFPEAYMAAIRTPDTSAHFHAEPGAVESFDLRADAGETVILAPEIPAATATARLLYQQLTALFALQATLDAEDAGGSFTLDEETRRQLVELNYVGGDDEVPVPEGTPLDRWPEGATRDR
jgi:arylsulfatase A-like enzyme